jgi:glutamyl-tRNA reductase
MGAGETGTLVAKAMSRRCLNPIFVANRTYERALRLAEELGGKAVKFDKLDEVLMDADVVFCSTSAPHYLLTKDLVSRLLAERKNKNHLLVIDISNPRNVEESIEDLPLVELFNIDDLTLIAERNKQERQKSMQDAIKIINEELVGLERSVKQDCVSEIVSDLLSQVEESRQRELVKALSMMDDLDERQRKIVGDLTSIMLKHMFLPVVENFRRAAANNETELVEVAAKLFEINQNSLNVC